MRALLSNILADAKKALEELRHIETMKLTPQLFTLTTENLLCPKCNIDSRVRVFQNRQLTLECGCSFTVTNYAFRLLK